MPPAQAQELVAEVKAWYETHKHDTRQRDLAAKLGVSPTGLCQIFAGVNQPSASTALAMIQFLEENQTMTNYLDPRTTPRATASNPGQPKTLQQAKEMLEARDAEIAALRGAVSLPPKPAAAPASPKAKAQSAGDPGADPTYPPTRTPGGDRPNPVPMPVNPPATPKKALPPEANTPVLIQRILDVTPLDPDLLSMLGNPLHTDLQRACIYTEVKKRRALEGV